VLNKIEGQGSNSGQPRKNVVISDCGEIKEKEE